MNLKERDERLSEDHQKGRVMCLCGHVSYIPLQKRKWICSWCGKMVYRDKKLEFKERLKGLGVNVRKDI